MELPDSKNEQFHQHLKEKFDAYSTKAPNGIWDEIAMELNQVENTKRSKIDDLVKSAANQQRTAPEFIWYSIEQKLNLEKVWEGMQPRLNKMRSNYRIKKAISYLSAAAILLLFIRSCDFNSISDNNTAFVENTFNKTPLKQAEKNKIPLASNLFNGHNLSKNSHTYIANKPHFSVKKNYKGTFINKGEKSEERPTEIKLESIENVVNEALNIEPFDGSQKDKFINKVPEPIDIKNALPESIIEKELSINTEGIPNQKKYKVVNYSVGLISSLRTTVFIDDQNSRKLNRISADNVALVPNLTFSYAVQIGAEFGRHAFDAEFWYKNKIVQEYRYTISGRRYSDLTEIDYLKINLLYRPQIFRYGRNKIIANAGLYISNLKGVSYSSTRHNFNSNNSELNLWEKGLIMGLAQEHMLSNHIALDYGFRNEIGLSGIFESGRNNILNTKLLGFSAFMNLRYRF